MEKDELIAIEVFCTHYGMEISFIHSLTQAGLIEIITVNDRNYVHHNYLDKLERFGRLHYEMDVNVEGLEIINHLLERIDGLQKEIKELKNRNIA